MCANEIALIKFELIVLKSTLIIEQQLKATRYPFGMQAINLAIADGLPSSRLTPHLKSLSTATQ